MSTWPNTLPEYPTASGYGRLIQSRKISFETETGAPKERNRSTAVPDLVKERYVLTSQQFQDLETFYRTTTKGGVEPFSKRNPETKSLDLYQFDGNLGEPNIIAGWYEVVINLKRLP